MPTRQIACSLVKLYPKLIFSPGYKLWIQKNYSWSNYETHAQSGWKFRLASDHKDELLVGLAAYQTTHISIGAPIISIACDFVTIKTF